MDNKELQALKASEPRWTWVHVDLEFTGRVLVGGTYSPEELGYWPTAYEASRGVRRDEGADAEFEVCSVIVEDNEGGGADIAYHLSPAAMKTIEALAIEAAQGAAKAANDADIEAHAACLAA